MTSAAQTYKGYAIPPYEVVASEGDFERRRYAPHLVVEVRVDGSPRGAVSKGFRALAGYIFGKNATSEKIAMTAPVSQMREGEAWVIRFMLPPGRALEDFPQAQRADITLTEALGGEFLVYRFSGRSAPGRMQTAEDKLRAHLAAQGLEPSGPPVWLYYDDPMTLPFRRRNEVAVPLD